MDRLDDADLLSEEMQKCLDSLKKIKSDLEEKIEVSERNAKNLEKEKVKVAKSLEAEKEKGLVQKQALGFVKEILTSPLVSDESTVKLYQAIDNIVAFIKEDVQEALKESGQLRDLSDAERQTLFSTDLEAWAITKKKKWIDGKTTIALLGEFSAGKTSILNCILSNSDSSAPQLPVEIRPTTAIPTYISGGLINGYQFVTPNNELKELSEKTFKRVSKDILAQVEGVSSLIQYFVMTCKNSNLNKLSILDTPGFSSTDKEDAERSIGVINECDALFWVVNISAGDLNESSLAILRKMAVHNKPLYIILNQIDLKSPRERKQTERQIKRTLTNNGIKYEGILQFSKNLKETLTPLMQTILSIKHDDGRETYLDKIVNLLQKAIDKAKEARLIAEQEKNRIRRDYDRVKKELRDEIDNISDKCFRIRNLPEFNKRTFSDNDFRLTQKKHSEFVNKLRGVCESCDQVKAKFEKLGQLGGKMATASDAYHVVVSRVNQLERCMESLETKEKELNRLSSSPSTKTRVKKASSMESAPLRSTSRRGASATDEDLSPEEIEDIESFHGCTEVEREKPVFKSNVDFFHRLVEEGKWPKDDEDDDDDDDDENDDEEENDEDEDEGERKKSGFASELTSIIANTANKKLSELLFGSKGQI